MATKVRFCHILFRFKLIYFNEIAVETHFFITFFRKNKKMDVYFSDYRNANF